jgi:flagellar biosynthetic protein FliR
MTDHDVLTYLGRFLWPFLRLTGLFLTAPLYGSSMVPSLVKAAGAAGYALALALWLPSLPPFPADPFSAIYAGLTQIAFGAALGLIMQLVILAAASAGEIAGLAMGLSFAELQFRDSPGVTPVLYDIMLWAGLLAFVTAGGPAFLFAALFHSFDTGIALPPITAWPALAALGGNLIATAVTLAMPVLAVSLSVNLTVGLMTVFSPQMNLLTIGFPLLILAGLWVTAGSTAYIGHGISAFLLTAMAAVESLHV